MLPSGDFESPASTIPPHRPVGGSHSLIWAGTGVNQDSAFFLPITHYSSKTYRIVTNYQCSNYTDTQIHRNQHRRCPLTPYLGASGCSRRPTLHCKTKSLTVAKSPSGRSLCAVAGIYKLARIHPKTSIRKYNRDTYQRCQQRHLLVGYNELTHDDPLYCRYSNAPSIS